MRNSRRLQGYDRILQYRAVLNFFSQHSTPPSICTHAHTHSIIGNVDTVIYDLRSKPRPSRNNIKTQEEKQITSTSKGTTITDSISKHGFDTVSSVCSVAPRWY